MLQTVPLADVAITDFSIHSIGIILTNGGKDDDLAKFVADVLLDTPLVVLRLGNSDINRILEVRRRHRLDFDDAYQYVAAEKHNLTLVSFDADFDKTERGRKTPAEALEEPPIAHDRPATKPRRRKA